MEPEPALPEDQLVHYFHQVWQERMQGMPIVNPRLSVAAVGFTDYLEDRVGVLITPWFMNLVLLPNGEFNANEQVGTKYMSSFPAGTYEFIVYSMEPDEAYRACSLFSPMEQFEDQEAALATAAHVMEALFVAEETAAQADDENQPEPPPAEPMEPVNPEPSLTTRRQWLRGQWSRRDG